MYIYKYVCIFVHIYIHNIYMFIYILYIHIYDIHNWKIIWISYRKLPWVEFQTTTTEFRSDALTDWAISPWVQLALRANFVQLLHFHRLFSIRFHFGYWLRQSPRLFLHPSEVFKKRKWPIWKLKFHADTAAIFSQMNKVLNLQCHGIFCIIWHHVKVFTKWKL